MYDLVEVMSEIQNFDIVPIKWAV